MFYIPDRVKEPSSGQQLQNYSLMEFKAIDRAAKAALPWLDEWLKNGRTIYYPEFVSQYISVLERRSARICLHRNRALHKNSIFAEARTLVRALKRPFLRPYFVRASAFFQLFVNFCAKPRNRT
jgi:hypothetical protein